VPIKGPQAGREQGPGWAWGAMILNELEQGPVFEALNFDLAVADPANVTARTNPLSVFVCPSSPTGGPVRLADASGTALVSDLAASTYVGSAGQFEPSLNPDKNNGLLFRNSRVRDKEIRDGASQTLLAGERSRNVADATWVGAIPEAKACTNPKWKNPGCEASMALVLAHTGPTPGQAWVETPNHKQAGADDFWSMHPGGGNFAFADGSVHFLKETIDPKVFSALSTRAGREVVSSDQF
jgi:prepilin-type processing-associated H-X9-DG protein